MEKREKKAKKKNEEDIKINITRWWKTAKSEEQRIKERKIKSRINSSGKSNTFFKLFRTHLSQSVFYHFSLRACSRFAHEKLLQLEKQKRKKNERRKDCWPTSFIKAQQSRKEKMLVKDDLIINSQAEWHLLSSFHHHKWHESSRLIISPLRISPLSAMLLINDVDIHSIIKIIMRLIQAQMTFM